MKKCSCCGETKNKSEFHRDKSKKSGLYSHCKDCKKKYRERSIKRIIEYRSKNSEHMKEYLKKRYTNKDRRKWMARWRSKNHEKIQAHKAVFYAIKNGDLKRPPKCSICCVECKPEAHHENYNKQLDVTWLCRQCHIAKHTKDYGF